MSRLAFARGNPSDRVVSQVSLHYASEGTTVFFWNRLSDHIGRKPVLLCCLAGTTVSMVLFGLSRSFLAIVFRYPHSPCTDLWSCDSLVYSFQSLSTWRAERKYGRREKCDGRTHGRIQRTSRIFLVTYDLVRWLYDRVGHHIYLLCPVFADISGFLARWLVAPYHDLRIAGRTSFHTHSGPNIHTSFLAWWSPFIVACHGS